MTYRHVTILSGLALLLVFAFPFAASAKLVSCTGGVAVSTVEKENWIRLQLPIPNVTTTCTDDNETATASDDVQRGYVKDMGQYIGGLYKYFVGAIGIIASLMVFYGGLRWLTAAGNASSVKDAKEIIFAALIAILIAFGSYTLLYTINKKLVQINPPVLKVADTFLTSFDNTCPTQKVCLSGTNVGRPCTTDAACPGASSGACELPIEDLEGANVVTATCGQSYTYKKLQDLKFTSETCIGTFCAGTEPLSTIPSGKVCALKSDPSKPPSQTAANDCFTPETACQSVPTSASDNFTCNQHSIADKGRCGFFDSWWYTIGVNHCVWRPLLVCPRGYGRVGCDAIVANNISCPVVRDIQGLDTVKVLAAIVGWAAQCTSTAGEQVYTLDNDADHSAVKSIGCGKKHCQSGSRVGNDCNYDTDCDGLTTPVGTCRPDAVPVKADLRCLSELVSE